MNRCGRVTVVVVADVDTAAIAAKNYENRRDNAASAPNLCGAAVTQTEDFTGRRT